MSRRKNNAKAAPPAVGRPPELNPALGIQPRESAPLESEAPDDTPDPFAGLLSPKVNPALGVAPKDENEPPELEARRLGYVPIGDVEVGLNVRVPRRVRDAAKAYALKRGLTVAQYITFLVERDARP